jgi:RNA polymerase sigma factor (sigma-70 family)
MSKKCQCLYLVGIGTMKQTKTSFCCMTDNELQQLLEGCRRKERSSQYRLYTSFYAYSMSIVRRYIRHSETAEEVINDAFFKIFTKFDLFSGAQLFKPWLRRVLINTAIDRLRSEMRHPPIEEIQAHQEEGTDAGMVEALTYQQVLAMLDRLPPSYRTVFNLFVVDGFSHEEIAESLQISVGASKSNLSRARQHLKTYLSEEYFFS